ncbi:MAG TPA: imidazole glycerol phosphate synthase subunit HisH [Planctomycetaceae bacterium]|nr:imidazole glycerol phosphate synthase subunit HisH [Planctomycetaceae bacterium]
MITVVDYGMGNLRSVQKAFEKLGVRAEISSDPDRVARAGMLVLPGVGAFCDAMEELRRRDLIAPIRDHIQADRPFLGICLGLQLLFDVSFEAGQWEGLGIIPGQVVRFQDAPGLKVPHMGWNRVRFVGESPLRDGIPDGSYFYFVHSYYVVPQDPTVVTAQTDYGVWFTSMIRRGNLFATQFHPEKSQRLGLRMLENFAKLATAPL